ncbi:hypothetical protein NDO41_07030 [Ectopseudomonas mendocina]|nr:hypothetical protein NDO41_07030 [Pseudomonas mendocina]
MQQQDWDDLKQQMASPYGYMKLKCDQFEVALSQEVDSKGRKWATSVYVDGVFKAAWCFADEKGQPKHEEARRFLRKVTRRVNSARDVAEIQKLFGKRQAKKAAERVYVYFAPSWSSFNSLKKHLVANNTSIERIH